MSELSSTEISHLAELARVRLSEAEVKEFAGELPKIVEFVEQLRAVKLDHDSSDERVTKLEDLRADEVSGERLSVETLKKLAPEWQSNQNVVPAVFGGTDEG